jgi:hypothetical protein
MQSLEKDFLTKVLPVIIEEIRYSDSYTIVPQIAERYKIKEEILIDILKENIYGLDGYMLYRKSSDPFCSSLIRFYIIYKHNRDKDGIQSDEKNRCERILQLVRSTIRKMVDLCNSLSDG